MSFCEYFRDVATKIAYHDYILLGDDEDIVEVDETHLFRAKYNVGRVLAWNAVWLFGIKLFYLNDTSNIILSTFLYCIIGGISRKTKQVFGQIVSDRSTETLLPIMQKFIDPGSFICSDMWRAYNVCSQFFR